MADAGSQAVTRPRQVTSQPSDGQVHRLEASLDRLIALLEAQAQAQIDQRRAEQTAAQCSQSPADESRLPKVTVFAPAHDASLQLVRGKNGAKDGDWTSRDAVSQSAQPDRNEGEEPESPEAARKHTHNFGFIGLRDASAEALTLRFWRDALCETVIVFFMVFGASMVGVSFPGSPSNLVGIAMSGGLFVFVLIEGFAHIQLSCMNPCAVLAFVCTKRLGFLKGVAYLGFELAGSALASKLVHACTPGHLQDRIQPLKLGPHVTTLAGVTVEWVLTGMLVWVVLGALDRDKRKVYMPGLPIGITIGMGIFVADKYTGGALNPLIVFGPAVVSGNWKHQWVYWVGDLGGAANAIILYYFFTYDGFPFRTKGIPHHALGQKRDAKFLRKDQSVSTNGSAPKVKDTVTVNGELHI